MKSLFVFAGLAQRTFHRMRVDEKNVNTASHGELAAAHSEDSLVTSTTTIDLGPGLQDRVAHAGSPDRTMAQVILTLARPISQQGHSAFPPNDRNKTANTYAIEITI